jgi:hypothetical protein
LGALSGFHPDKTAREFNNSARHRKKEALHKEKNQLIDEAAQKFKPGTLETYESQDLTQFP